MKEQGFQPWDAEEHQFFREFAANGRGYVVLLDSYRFLEEHEFFEERILAVAAWLGAKNEELAQAKRKGAAIAPGRAGAHGPSAGGCGKCCYRRRGLFGASTFLTGVRLKEVVWVFSGQGARRGWMARRIAARGWSLGTGQLKIVARLGGYSGGQLHRRGHGKRGRVARAGGRRSQARRHVDGRPDLAVPDVQ